MPYKISKKGDKHCVVKDDGKQVACHDTRASALKQMKALYANEQADAAYELQGVEVITGAPVIPCSEQDCERAFLDFDKMVDHAEAVHTFGDIQRLVSEVVRETYAKPSDYTKKPPVPGVYAWVEDLAEDWVVFSVEKPKDMTLFKAPYSITDGKVTLGKPEEVKRRTVYDVVKKG